MTTKKGILMAGGYGTRLPGKKYMNKHALLVYDKAMITYPVQTMVDAGIDEILVIQNGRYPSAIMEILEDGSDFGCEILYKYVYEPEDPFRQVMLAEKWAQGEDLLLLYGDGLFLSKLDIASVTAPHMWIISRDDDFDSPRKYSHVIMDKDGTITSIVKKPREIQSKFVEVDSWLLPGSVFDDIRSLEDKDDGSERHGTDIMSMYIGQHGKLSYSVLPERTFLDLGTPDALLKGANLVKLNQFSFFI